MKISIKDRQGVLRGALHFCTSFLNYDSCFSKLYIIGKVIFFLSNDVCVILIGQEL